MSGLSKYATVVVPLGTAIGLAYLFGYWGAFGINVLEYIGLSDVVRLSLYPMLIAIAASVAGNFIGIVGASGRQRKAETVEAEDPWLARFFRRFGHAMWWVLALSFFAAIVWAPEPIKWVLLAMIFYFMLVPAANSPALVALCPSPSLRTTLFMAVVLIPGMAFAFGRQNAYQLKQGRQEHAIDVTRLPEAIGIRSTPQRQVMYVGKIGDRVALFETLSAQLLLIRDDQIPILPIREK